MTEDVDPDGDNLLEVSGKLNITDSDAGEAAFIAKTINSSFGSLTIDTAGNWNYGANNGQTAIQNLTNADTLTDLLTISSVDGTTHTIVITIKGVNEPNSAAVISGTNTGNVTEDVDPDGDNLLEVSGKLNITDSDAGEAAFIAKTINSSFGSLTIDTAGNWNYGANNGQAAIQGLTNTDTLTDLLTISSVDGTKHTIVITIIGVNETVSSTADVTLSWVAPAEREDNKPISLSEIAGYKIYYGTAQGSYNNSIDINDGTATGYTFTSFSAGTYYFVITTRDVDGRESQYSTEVIIVI
ncbi:MAG: VCBS domain-containing protein [Gammaproteobacteria bacterium]